MQVNVAEPGASGIEVLRYEEANRGEWQAFVGASNNGTIFHDLDFLDYHPKDRFQTHHLMFRKQGELVAVLPAALARAGDKTILKSPYGASIGGPVLPPGQLSLVTIDVVKALKQYAAELPADGIEVRVGPAQYCREPDDHLGFALAAAGFRLDVRWLSYIVDLPGDPAQALDGFKKPKLRDIRVGLRKGLVSRRAEPELLDSFYRILLETNAKHNSTPTHSLEELKDLFRRLPDRLRLYLCQKDGLEIAGMLVFALNEVAAYIFYTCQDDAYSQLRPTTVLMAHVAEDVTRDGFRVLDWGPTSFEDFSVNEGLAVFKESFGARAFCRDTWRLSGG